MALPHKQRSAMLAPLLAADTCGSLQAGNVMPDLPHDDRAYWVAVAAACRSPTPARRPTMNQLEKLVGDASSFAPLIHTNRSLAWDFVSSMLGQEQLEVELQL